MTYQEFLDNVNTEIFTLNGEPFDLERDDQQLLMRVSLSYTVPWNRATSTKDDYRIACKSFWDMIME